MLKLNDKQKKIVLTIFLVVVIIGSFSLILEYGRKIMGNNVANYPPKIFFSDETDIQKLNFSTLMNGKQLLISYYSLDNTFGIDLGNFVKRDRGDDVIEYINNEKKVGSMQQSFKYFFNEKQLLNEYAYGGGEDYQYEEDTLLDGTKFYYINKSTEDDREELHAGHGMILMWEPTVKAGKFEGSQLINYYNVEVSEGEERGYAFTEDSTLMGTHCIISLNQVDDTEFGYLVFEGTASAGSEINYCEWLNDVTVFDLYVNKLVGDN